MAVQASSLGNIVVNTSDELELTVERDVAVPMRDGTLLRADVYRPARQERPIGYLVREAPQDDVRALQQLAGHLQAGLFITKFRKTFARDEMNDDLLIIPARYGDAEDDSEYEELLPVSPP